MRSHRIWNTVNASSYSRPASKSFGGEFVARVNVGSSASYSDELAKVEARELPLNGTDWSLFVLYVDGEQIKRKAFNNKTRDFLALDLHTPALAQIEAYERGEAVRSDGPLVTLAKGGTAERTVAASDLNVPDLWNIAAAVDDSVSKKAGDMVRECWHLAHDLLRHVRGES